MERVGQRRRISGRHEQSPVAERFAQAREVAGHHGYPGNGRGVEHAALGDLRVRDDDDSRRGEQRGRVGRVHEADQAHAVAKTSPLDRAPELQLVFAITQTERPEDARTGPYRSRDHDVDPVASDETPVAQLPDRLDDVFETLVGMEVAEAEHERPSASAVPGESVSLLHRGERRRIEAPGRRRWAAERRRPDPPGIARALPLHQFVRVRRVHDHGVGNSDEGSVNAARDRAEQVELAPDLVQRDDDAGVGSGPSGPYACGDRGERGQPEGGNGELVVHDLGPEPLDQPGGGPGAPRVTGEDPVHTTHRHLRRREARRHDVDVDAVDAPERVDQPPRVLTDAVGLRRVRSHEERLHPTTTGGVGPSDACAVAIGSGAPPWSTSP